MTEVDDDKCSGCGRYDVCAECQIAEIEAFGKTVPADLRVEADIQRREARRPSPPVAQAAGQ
jgi:hypothetical protein